MRKTDPNTSTTLIELVTDPDRYILIQDLVNGGNLNYVLGCREFPLTEREVQLIMKKLAEGLNMIYKKQIIHRDININNVMLHFPDLEPSDDELQDPTLLVQLEVLKQKKIQNLIGENFQVKIVDFGLACHLNHGDFAV